MSTKTKSLVDKCKGSIIGAVIGDALGMPTEYISPQELKRVYNGKVTKFENPTNYHPCAHLEAGQYTDDTQQLILLAESLVQHKDFDFNDFAQKIGIWANKCLTDPTYNRFAGGTSLRAGLEIYSGKDPQHTGKVSATCGSAMRIAPIGLVYHNHPTTRREAAKDAARITHNHSTTIDAAVLIADIVSNVVNDVEPREAVAQARAVMESSLQKNIDYVFERSTTHPQEIMKHIGAFEQVHETVPMAVSCFLYSPDDFSEVVINAANLVPGDTDSIACIAGAMAGARNGHEAIPAHFKDNIEDKQMLEQLAEELAETSLKI